MDPSWLPKQRKKTHFQSNIAALVRTIYLTFSSFHFPFLRHPSTGPQLELIRHSGRGYQEADHRLHLISVELIHAIKRREHYFVLTYDVALL